MKSNSTIKKMFSCLLIISLLCTTLFYGTTVVKAAKLDDNDSNDALQTTIPPTESDDIAGEAEINCNITEKSDNQTKVRGGGASFSKATEVDFNSTMSVTIKTAGEKNYFKFHPTVTGEYVFFSVSSSGDPVASLYNSNRDILFSDEKGSGSQHFRISAHLVAGLVYYIEAGHNGDKTGQYNIAIVRDSNLANGNYYLQNYGTNNYLDIHGPVEQYYIHQWSFSYGNQAKWTLTRNSNGYYTIRSLYGSKKYVAISTTNVNVNNVVLQDSIANSTYWKIYTDSAGRLYFEPKLATGKVLYAPNNSIGTELQLQNIGDATGGKQLWYPLRFQYAYSINHYYDNGFNVRFPNGASELPEYQRVVSNALLRIFGLSTNVNGIQMYVSAADSCCGTPVTVSETTTPCTHDPVHKNRTALMTHMASSYGYGTNTTVKSIWTGHNLVVNRAVSFPSPDYTIVLPPQSTTRAGRIYMLMHETSHQLGATDHYCYEDGTNGCTNLDCWSCYFNYSVRPTCIMDAWDLNIESKLSSGNLSSIYCSTCLSYTHDDGIFKHLNNHH